MKLVELSIFRGYNWIPKLWGKSKGTQSDIPRKAVDALPMSTELWNEAYGEGRAD